MQQRARRHHPEKVVPSEQFAKPLCVTPPPPVRQFSPTVMADPNRARAILLTEGIWQNGTTIHYWFFREGHWSVPENQAEKVREAFAEWKAVGIGLEFEEVSQRSEAEVRIGYSLKKPHESKSAVGRTGVLDAAARFPNVPTTQYGWDLTQDESGTAAHELGHVLGLMHEHQSPFAGIRWHEQAVYDYFAGPPNNWDRETIVSNVLMKLDRRQVQGSKWDPDSIMEYAFPPGLIAEPRQYERGLRPPGTLSDTDKQWALYWYPPRQAPITAQPFQSAAFDLTGGQQVDFEIKPAESRKYTLETKGSTDAVLVLFEDVNGAPRYLSGDDDSGEERNASITYKLLQGRSYIARLRLVYPGPTGKTSFMYY